MENAAAVHWHTLDGALSFASECCSNAGVSFEVKVRISRTEHPNHCDVVIIQSDVVAESCVRSRHFNIRFPGGYLAHGKLHWKHEVGVGGEVVILWVDVKHGADGTQGQTSHGVLARFAVEGSQLFPLPQSPFTPEPEPEPEPESEPESEPEPARPPPVGDGGDSALFPYLYIRQWPLVGADKKQLRFLSYVPQAIPPQQSFYAALAGCSSRAEMEKLAVSFIQGASPYESQFVTQTDLSAGTFALLARLKETVLASDYTAKTVSAWIAAHMAAGDSVPPGYGVDVERIWDSYFALIVVPWSMPALLPHMCGLLVASHLLAYVIAPPLGAPPINRAALRELVQASNILPDGFFAPPAENESPVPASPQVKEPPPAVSGWIEPCSIGDLQMVRQRLLRHVPGEIAAIENLMRGERKEISRRRMRRQLDVSLSQTLGAEELDDSSTNTRDDLHAETIRTIAEKTTNKSYTNLTTNYGPPTMATVNGGPVTTTVQQGPNTDDATRFAREVLRKTVSRISRSVGDMRGSSVMHETAETITSSIDNSNGVSNQVYVLRWVNKVYEAHVVNYGCRLMVEFVLTQPAAAYFRNVAPGERAAFGPPRSLEALGVDSFKKITPDNYASLAAEYRSTAISPPPEARRDVSALLAEGESTLVAVPPGYQPQIATARALAAPGVGWPLVMVGVNTLQSPYTPIVIPFGCGNSLVVAVGSAATVASPQSEKAVTNASALAITPAPTPTPAPTMEPAPDPVRVNVTIKCVPTTSTIDEWRIKTYNALLDAWQALCTSSVAVDIPQHTARKRSALAARRVERRELRRGCLELLQQRCTKLTGYLDPAVPTFAQGTLAGPGRVQFIDDMFEWDEMSVQFYRRDGGAHYPLAIDDDGTDAPPLAAFQAADLARVLVPARPRDALTLLYLLSSGQLWEGGHDTVPVDANDVAIVSALKSADEAARTGSQCVGQPWEILVPTAMQIIDGAPLEAIL
jgi:hypothetical protein